MNARVFPPPFFFFIISLTISFLFLFSLQQTHSFSPSFSFNTHTLSLSLSLVSLSPLASPPYSPLHSYYSFQLGPSTTPVRFLLPTTPFTRKQHKTIFTKQLTHIPIDPNNTLSLSLSQHTHTLSVGFSFLVHRFYRLWTQLQQPATNNNKEKPAYIYSSHIHTHGQLRQSLFSLPLSLCFTHTNKLNT